VSVCRAIFGSSKRKAILAVLLLSMAFVTTWLWRSLLRPDRFSRLQIGMTPMQVSEVLHQRLAINLLSQSTDDQRTWAYSYSDGELFPERLATLTFEDGKLSEKKADPLPARAILRHWWNRQMNR
jgi:hypothetical protein